MVLRLGLASLAWVGFIASSHAPRYQAAVAAVAVAGGVACSLAPARHLIFPGRRQRLGNETIGLAAFGAIVGMVAANVSEAIAAFVLSACGGWLIVLSLRSFAGARRPAAG